MGSQKVSQVQAGFAGGLNIATDPALVGPDQAVRMDNCRLTTFGAALRRLGTALTSTSAVTTVTQATNIGAIYWPSQNKGYVVAPTTNSAVNQIYSTSYAFPSAGTWTAVATCAAGFRPVIFSDGTNEMMYIAGDNTNGVQKFDGTTVTQLGASTPKVSGLCVYNDRLWGWLGNSLYFSNLSSASGSIGGDSIGDPSNGGGQIVINTFGESIIEAAAAVNGNLLIFHQKGISVLTGWGQSDIQVSPQALNSTIGMIPIGSGIGLCVANEISTGDTAYFMTTQGLYATNGGWVRPIDNPQKPDPIAALIRQGISPQALGTMVAFNRAKNEVWVGNCGFLGPNVPRGVYIYNVVLQSWSGPFTGTYTDEFGSGTTTEWLLFEMLDGGGAPHLWLAAHNGTAAGFWVMETDSLLGGGIWKDRVVPGVGGGSAYTSTLQFHRLFGNDDRVYSKSWRWLNVVATMTSANTSPTVSYTTALNGTQTNTMGTLSSTSNTYRVAVGGAGPYIDVQIQDSGNAGSSQYAYATVEGHLLGIR